MNRRDSLKLMAAGTGAVLLPLFPALAAENVSLIYDSRFTRDDPGVDNVHTAFDCRGDVASLWYAHFSRNSALSGPISGLTTAADAMIVSDLARRDGRRVEWTAAHPGGQLVAWRLSARTR